jgi:probable F420-dependent oxidoreductase
MPPRPLKLGIQLPEVEREVRWPELRAMARRAEEVGFDSLWLGDHLLYRRPAQPPKGPWEAWSTLAALAEATSRVELGPLVASTSFHNPAMLAKKAATLDEISGGRLVLGLGAGWNEVEYEAYGFPFDHRVDRFEEAFTIIRTLLREGHIDFEGRYYQARDCELVPRGPRAGGPPLMIGSNGRRMLRIAAPHVDSWNVWHDLFANDASRLGPFITALDEACAEVGRDPREIERTATMLVQLPGGSGRAQGGDWGERTPALRAAPEELGRAIEAYRALGISHIQLVLDPITIESIEALAPTLETLRRP